MSTGFCQFPLRLRRRYSIIFIQFLGVIQYAPNDVAEIAAMIARISIVFIRLHNYIDYTVLLRYTSVSTTAKIGQGIKTRPSFDDVQAQFFPEQYLVTHPQIQLI